MLNMKLEDLMKLAIDVSAFLFGVVVFFLASGLAAYWMVR